MTWSKTLHSIFNHTLSVLYQKICLRKYMEEQKLDISQEALNSIKKYRGKELEKKKCVKMYIGIRKNNNDLNYLDMYRLAEETCDPEKPNHL